MEKITADQLTEILHKHDLWLDDKEGGELADLRYADLRYADLSYADLSYADLRYADLRYADLSYADLSYADLSYANLRYADLRYADLSYANLSYADLRSANLRYADLRSANLRYADLSYADLRYADLSYADLRSANLRYADLRYADLIEVNCLWGCVGNMLEIKSIQCDLYEVTYTAEKLQIGCKFHEISEWWNFSDSEISRMDAGALDWWKVWKPILKQIIESSPAKLCVITEENQEAEGVAQ